MRKMPMPLPSLNGIWVKHWTPTLSFIEQYRASAFRLTINERYLAPNREGARFF